MACDLGRKGRVAAARRLKNDLYICNSRAGRNSHYKLIEIMKNSVILAVVATMLSLTMAACNKQGETPIAGPKGNSDSLTAAHAEATPTLYRTVTTEEYQAASKEEQLVFDFVDAAVNSLRIGDPTGSKGWEAFFIFAPESNDLFDNTLMVGPANSGSGHRGEPEDPGEGEAKETCRACNKEQGAICASKVVEKAKAQKDKRLEVEIIIDKEGCTVMKY